MANSISVSKTVLHTMADVTSSLDVELPEVDSSVAVAATDGISQQDNDRVFGRSHADLGMSFPFLTKALSMLIDPAASVGAQFHTVDSESTCRVSKRRGSLDGALDSKL